MIAIRDLAVDLGGRRVLGPLDLALEAGGLIALIGPNGAGKSTLARAIAGLLRYQGSIMIAGHDLCALTPQERAKRIAYLPQGQSVHWPMAVQDVVALGRLPHRARMMGDLTAHDLAAIDRAMAATDTAQFATRPVDQLSGGEAARVLLARALASDAPVLIADEPIAALDIAHQIAILEQIRAQVRDQVRIEGKAGRLAIVILHDLKLAAQFADRVVLLAGGQLLADGPPDAVITADRLAQVYGVVPAGPCHPLFGAQFLPIAPENHQG